MTIKQKISAILTESQGIHVWHVTRKAAIQSIMQTGLTPGRGALSKSAGETQDAIYVFPDGLSIEDAITNWLGDEMGEETLSVLELTVPAEWITHDAVRWEATITRPVPPSAIRVLIPDVDQWDGTYPGQPPAEWYSE